MNFDRLNSQTIAALIEPRKHTEQGTSQMWRGMPVMRMSHEKEPSTRDEVIDLCAVLHHMSLFQ